MLDRLVGWAILTKSYGIMGHDINRWNAHQSRQTHRTAGIVGETHECAAVWANAAVQRHAIHRCCHAVLTDSEIDIAAGPVVWVKNTHIFSLCVVGSGEIG